MHLRTCAAALLALAASLPAAAQPERDVTVPREIVADLLPRFAADTPLHTPEGLAAELKARAVDLNGDGRPEYVVSARQILCGATGNCRRWVYRRMPNGRFRMLLETGGTGLDLLRTASKGFRDLRTPGHFSARETFHTVYHFDGERYVDVATELHVEARGIVFRVSSPLPAAGRPRRVRLEERAAAQSGSLRMAADYEACAPARATPGRLCGSPRLVLSEPGGERRLPAAGARCLILRVETLEGERHEWTLPCEAAPAAGGAAQGRRAVALRPTAEQWTALGKAFEIHLVAPDASWEADNFADLALSNFVSRVWELNGMELYPEDDETGS